MMFLGCVQVAVAKGLWGLRGSKGLFDSIIKWNIVDKGPVSLNLQDIVHLGPQALEYGRYIQYNGHMCTVK